MNKMFLEKIAFGNEGYPWSLSENGKKMKYYPGMCPVAERVCEQAIIIPHARYPNKLSDMEDIVLAFKKVSDHVEELNKI